MARDSFFGQPRGLAYLAFTESWERFSFSGMQALLVLYMVDQLLTPGHIETVAGFETLRTFLESVYGPLSPQPLSSAVFGLYTGLVFFLPVLGGYLGDRYFGQQAMVLAGAVFMAAGHFLMAFEPSFLLALALLIIGAGCLKGNISKQVAGLYANDDPRRSDGFQIFSMAINIGVIVAPLVCGTLGELWGWHYGFGAAGIGMMIGMAIYIAGRRHLPPDTIVRSENAGSVSTIMPDSRRILLILIAAFVLTTCFLVTAGQLGNVYGLWLLDDVDRSIGSVTIPVTWFQSLTPLFSVAATPLIIAWWRRQALRGREPAIFVKIAAGLGMAGVGLLLLGLLSLTGSAVPWWALLPTHALVCLAYIFVYPVALTLFSQVAPASAQAMYIGIFFLSSFVASNLVGFLGGMYADIEPAWFWSLQGMIGLGGMMVALLMSVVARPRVAPSGESHAQ